ncbi:MAG TPA: hypothetical protein VEP68_01790, partial [Anaeromyxobacteraceae bacterium]|nr:hypothetical protein [Anaeromyxobacteraceae bacterium]
MRYFVKNARGDELVCPSLGDLAALYSQGFLEDGDLVRAERSQRWVPAGSLPALRGLRERRREPWKVMTLLVAASILALAMALLLRL